MDGNGATEAAVLEKHLHTGSINGNQTIVSVKREQECQICFLSINKLCFAGLFGVGKEGVCRG